MSLPLDAAGHTLWLQPDGTLWWPAKRRLFVADLHLGKGAAFRAQGQPVPAGGSAHTLARLSAQVRALGAEQLVVLGDFWHGRAGLVPPLLQAVAAFAQRIDTLLVLGNHDRSIHPEGLPLRISHDPVVFGTITAAHEPPPLGAPGFTLAGHLHPAITLHSRAGDRLRRPCFVHWPHALVLPAYGGLTGAQALDRRALAREGGRVAVLTTLGARWLP